MVCKEVYYNTLDGNHNQETLLAVKEIVRPAVE